MILDQLHSKVELHLVSVAASFFDGSRWGNAGWEQRERKAAAAPIKLEKDFNFEKVIRGQHQRYPPPKNITFLQTTYYG